LDGGKAPLPAPLVRGNPLHHLVVERFGGGEIGGPGAVAGRDALGERRLARPGATQNQDMTVQCLLPSAGGNVSERRALCSVSQRPCHPLETDLRFDLIILSSYAQSQYGPPAIRSFSDRAQIFSRR